MRVPAANGIPVRRPVVCRGGRNDRPCSISDMNSIPSLKADIALAGSVNDQMLTSFVDQLARSA